MSKIILEDLNKLNLELSDTHCDFFSENSIVAFENNSHLTGCTLDVVGKRKKRFTIFWSKTFPRGGYKELKKITEHGAEALSFFLTRHFTDFTIVEEAVIGTGIDYWLGYESSHKNYNPRNFMQARLEISGINKETKSNNLEKRVEDKKIQSTQSAHSNLPAYISVVEFSTPKAYFGKK